MKSLFNQKKSFWIICGIITILLTCVTYFLFQRQAVRYNGMYPSDLPLHINLALGYNQESSYSVMYKLIGILVSFSSSYYVLALFEACCVGATYLLTCLLVKYYLMDNDYIALFLPLGAMFLSQIYIPVVHPFFYWNSILTQPWHNITYIVSRMFAILTIMLFLPLYKSYCDKKINVKLYISVVLFLAFTTMIKPNFLMAFAGALLIVLIYDFLAKKNKFLNEVLLGLVVIPACIILLFQGKLLYVDADNSQVLFGASTFFFREGIIGVICKLLSGFLIPLIICIKERKKMNRETLFIFLMFFIAIFEFMFFYEGGERALHGNFSWGAYFGAFFAYLYIMTYFLKDFKQKRIGSKIAIIALSLLHLISGLYYFIWVLCGNAYSI